MRTYGRFLLAGLVGLLVGVAPLPPTQAAALADTFVTMVGDGDYVAGNAARLWRPGPGSVQVSGSVRGIVSVNVSGGASGESYSLWFAAPPGQTLQPGSYVDAQRASFRTAGHPGIDISGAGRGCNETTGRFTVLDAPADLSRLWLVYEQHCEGGEPAVFGEVRIGEPADSADLMVAAGRISWPTEYLDSDAKVVPVNLFATGTRPVDVGGASITDGDADFSVVGNTCPSTLEPGQSCTVHVGFRPATRGHRTGVLVIKDSTAVGRHLVRLEGDTVPGRTAWSLDSQSGDRFGGGAWDLDPRTAVFSASGDDHHVFLRAVARSSGTEWSADLQAGPGQALLPGTTVTPASAYSSSDPQSASMLVGGWGSCNTVTGSFTVEDATYDQGRLRSLLVSFEQHCNGADAALTGTIAWRARTGDDSAPAGVTDLHAEATPGGAELSWQDPDDGSWVETVVRRSTGLVAPALVTAGEGVYHGSAVGVSAASRSSAGKRIVLAGRLTDVTSAGALAGRTVRLESRHGRGSWVPEGTTQTDATGSYALADAPLNTTDYRLTYLGSTDHLSAASRVVTVTVAPLVSLTADRTVGGRHAAFTFTSTVFPKRPGATVILQRHRADGWHNERFKPLSAASTVMFRVQPDRRGTFTYRVRRPADALNTQGLSRELTLRVR